MRILQSIFMLALTVAVAGVFLFHTSPEDQEVANLRATVRAQEATLTFWERQPTVLPSPTPAGDEAENAPAEGFVSVPGSDVSPTPGIQFPTPTPILATSAPAANPGTVGNTSTAANPVTSGNADSTPNPGGTTSNTTTTGARITRVDAASQVDGAGCAISPQNSFATFDTIYGVATLAEMAIGDTLAVRFNGPDNTLIYEESFTVQIAGDFCRWYVIEPDSEGWADGSYTISYTINGTQTRSASYTVGGGGGGGAAADGNPLAPPLGGEDDQMNDAP
ncbi:MAG: hypothetical protein ACLFTK_11995 [Anaerolineales bacterium]